jgi:hypothetical protein
MSGNCRHSLSHAPPSTAGRLAQRHGSRRVYPALLFAAAALIGVAGHLGGMLVWGADFFRP